MFSAGPSGILGRIAVFCTLSAFILGHTTDHFMGRSALDVSFLPEFFKSASLPAASLEKLGDGREEQAFTLARNAVLKQPLSVNSLSALAQTSAVVNSNMSSNALSQAAALGWRNLFVQVAVVNSAALVNNWKVVAPRVLALASLNKLDELDPAIFAGTNVPEYTQQIAPVFSSSGLAWFKFIKWLGDNSLNRERDGLLMQTPVYVREADCVRLGQVASELVREGQVSFAADLIRSRCQSFLTSASSGLVIDEHFGDSQRGPFEWQMISHSGVSFNISTGDGSVRLEVINSDPIDRRIASKIVRIDRLENLSEPFFHRLEDGDVKNDNFLMEVQCVEGSSKGAKYENVSFAKRDADCHFVHITFQIPNGHFQMGV